MFSVITCVNANIRIGPLDFERFQLLCHLRSFIKCRSRERLSATLDPDVPWGLHFNCFQVAHQQLLGFQLLKFRCFNRPLVDVVLEVALFDATIWKLHPPNTVLDAFDPIALIARAIDPVHLAVTMPLIILIRTFVTVARLPHESAKPILLVVRIITLIGVAVYIVEAFLPLAFPVLLAVFELTDVYAAVLPLILS